MKSMKCARCDKKDAAIELKYANEFLCTLCFSRLFEKRVRRTIRKNKLFRPGDKIAVAISGGKDSVTLLYLLSKLFSKLSGKAPGSELIAISIDQGIGDCKGYEEYGKYKERQEYRTYNEQQEYETYKKQHERQRYQRNCLEYSKSLCETLGIVHHIYSFKDEFGITLDDIVKKSRELENPAPACSYCGVLRRRLLNDKARELGCTKIATGHNLDDEVQVALMNFIRGDINRIARMGARVGVIRDPGFVSRIKPLRDCLENEVEIYAGLKDLEFEHGICPYSKEAFRGTIKEMINKIEENHPGSKFQTLKGTDQLIPILRESIRKDGIDRDGIKECGVCGSLTSGDLCKVCEIKDLLDIQELLR